MREALIIVSHGFGAASGPSIALLHTLRGLARFFGGIHVLNTVHREHNYDKILSYLPKNVKLINFAIGERPHTLALLGKSSQLRLCLRFREAVERLRARHGGLTS